MKVEVPPLIFFFSFLTAFLKATMYQETVSLRAAPGYTAGHLLLSHLGAMPFVFRHELMGMSYVHMEPQ